MQYQEHYNGFESHVIIINSSWTRVYIHTTGLQQKIGLKGQKVEEFITRSFGVFFFNKTKPILLC
jgi:hypothetical protein